MLLAMDMLCRSQFYNYIIHIQIALINSYRNYQSGRIHRPYNISDQSSFIGLAYQGKDIVFRFIIEYSSLRDFGP
jgi:hypothetical protein